MADTKHDHTVSADPVECDGISYGGIVWFLVILTITTLFCQALVWGMFELMAYRSEREDRTVTARAPLATPQGQNPPGPNLMTDEPTNLRTFRHKEDDLLHGYSWVQPGVEARLPIERAKELVLERGLPLRPAAAPAVAVTPAQGRN